MMRKLLQHMLRLLSACCVGLAVLLSSFTLVQQISAPIAFQHTTSALVSADMSMNDPLAVMADLIMIGVMGIGLASMWLWLLRGITAIAWNTHVPPDYAVLPGGTRRLVMPVGAGYVHWDDALHRMHSTVFNDIFRSNTS